MLRLKNSLRNIKNIQYCLQETPKKWDEVEIEFLYDDKKFIGTNQ
jgi:hypothetical protein